MKKKLLVHSNLFSPMWAPIHNHFPTSLWYHNLLLFISVQLSFPSVDSHRVSASCSKVFYLLSQPVKGIQSSLNPERLSRPAEKVWFDRCPADDHIPPLPPLHIQHKEIPSLPTFVQCSLWLNCRTSSSLQQTSLFDLNWHTSVDNRHLLQRFTFSLSCPPLRPPGNFLQCWVLSR